MTTHDASVVQLLLDVQRLLPIDTLLQNLGCPPNRWFPVALPLSAILKGFPTWRHSHLHHGQGGSWSWLSYRTPHSQKLDDPYQTQAKAALAYAHFGPLGMGLQLVNSPNVRRQKRRAHVLKIFSAASLESGSWHSDQMRLTQGANRTGRSVAAAFPHGAVFFIRTHLSGTS